MDLLKTLDDLVIDTASSLIGLDADRRQNCTELINRSTSDGGFGIHRTQDTAHFAFLASSLHAESIIQNLTQKTETKTEAEVPPIKSCDFMKHIQHALSQHPGVRTLEEFNNDPCAFLSTHQVPRGLQHTLSLEAYAKKQEEHKTWLKQQTVGRKAHVAATCAPGASNLIHLLKFNGQYHINNDAWHTYCHIRLGHQSDWPSSLNGKCPLCDMDLTNDQAINHALSCKNVRTTGKSTILHNRIVHKFVHSLRTIRPGLVTQEYESQWSHNPNDLRPDFNTWTFDLHNEIIATAYDFTAHSATCQTNLDKTRARIPEAPGGKGLMPPTAIIDYFDKQKRDKYTATARENNFNFEPLAIELNGGFSRKTGAILKKWSEEHPDGLVFADILHCELARCCLDLHRQYYKAITQVIQGRRPRGCSSNIRAPTYVVDASPNPPTLCVIPGSTHALPVAS